MIIFLYGEDSYRSRQKLKEFKDKFWREVDPLGSGLITIDGEKATMEKINEVVASSSLFAKKRMIVIERLFAQKSKTVLEQMHNYLERAQGLDGRPGREAKKATAKAENVSAGNILVFWENTGAPGKFGASLWQALSRVRFAQNFKSLSNNETTNWIKEEVAKRGGQIRQQAAVRLASLLGGNLWQLANEIDKLTSYKLGQTNKLLDTGGGIVIEATDVDNLVKGQLDENIFALTDAIGNKNKAEALRLFDQELEAGVTENHLLHMILRQFRILLQVRQSLDKGLSARKIASQLKIHPFVVQKSLNQVRNFSLPVIKNIFSRIVKADKTIKTGQADAKTVLTMLLARI